MLVVRLPTKMVGWLVRMARFFSRVQNTKQVAGGGERPKTGREKAMYCTVQDLSFGFKEGWNGWLSFYCPLFKVSCANCALMANWEVAKFAFLKLQIDAAQRAEKVGKFAYEASSLSHTFNNAAIEQRRKTCYAAQRETRARKLVKTALNAVHRHRL